MNKQDFIKILQKPVDISAADIKKLEELAVNFPFCQIAHILIAKGNFDYGSMLTEQKIKKAALYTTDRRNLKKFIQLREINPADLIPDYEFNQEENAAETSVVENENQSRKTSIIDSFLEKFHGPSDVLPPEEKDAQGEPPQPVVGRGQLLGTFLNFSRKEEKKAGTGSNLHRELLDNLEKLKALKDSLGDKNKNTKPKPFNRTEKEIDSTDPSSEKTDSDTTGETELLNGYIDFLQSKKTFLKRDPDKINQIIDKFIKEDPTIPPLKMGKTEENLPDLSTAPKKVFKSPVSENFANILEKQGKYSKAIEIYEELILKFPEKSSYFATRITELKKQL